jgi:polysaccharide biosynthesis protein PslH
MKILYLTTILPRRRNNGGKIVSQYFIDALERSGYEVTVLGYQRINSGYKLNDREILIDERYIETEGAKYYAMIWMFWSFLTNSPYSVMKYYSSKYKQQVKLLLAANDYAAIVIDHAQIGWLEKYIPEKYKIIFCAHNIENKIYLENCKDTKNLIFKQIYRRESKSIAKLEHRLAVNAREVWTLTKDDREYFAKIATSDRVKLFAVPSPMSLSGAEADVAIEKEFDLGLIGSWTWKANLAGLDWFFDLVYPLLPKNIKIVVAGKGVDRPIDKYDNVEYWGFVPDVREFMSQARIIAIPSISGGGIQIKTLDAIASGVQIIATPFALRGIYNYPSSVTIAPTPAEFATRTIELLSQSNCNSLSPAALQWSLERHQKFLAEVDETMRSTFF